MNLMIELSQIEQNFGNKQVLNNVNLKIKYGEIFGLLGPSGAGKTTLIKILTGQLKQTAGTATLLGKDTSTLTGRDYNQIGIMMDNFGLYERLSCYDNLKFFAQIYGIPYSCVTEALENVGLTDARKTTVMNLSKGMRNRLLLARALMQKPSVLFLDEPTSGLDPATTKEIHKLIYRERERGVTIFLTTHNMAEAAELCDHIALLNDGHIVEYGSPKEICRRYNHQKKLLLHLQDGTDITLPHDTSVSQKLCQYFEAGLPETIHSTEPNLETVFMELTGRSFE